MKLKFRNILASCTTHSTDAITPPKTSRAWQCTGWTYCVYDWLDYESALRLCVVNHAMYEDFCEKYARWKKTFMVSGRRTFVQTRVCMACGMCTNDDDDFVAHESNRWDCSGKCYITCKSTECYMKALTSMYSMKTNDCRIDGIWGSSIQTKYAYMEIPRKITIDHDVGTNTNASIVATRRSNRLVLYCCGGNIFSKVIWESAAGNEYTTVRDIRVIWEKRTLANQESIMRFIRRTIHNIRQFVRQTRVWGEELSEVWTEAVDKLEAAISREIGVL